MNEEKEINNDPLPGETNESYFSRVLTENLDIPDNMSQEFSNFLNQQTSAFRQIHERESENTRHARELGFDTLEEYHKHVDREKRWRRTVARSRQIDASHHIQNTFMAEAVFADTNREAINFVYPNYINREILGSHSHQILSDFIYRTCRQASRSLVESVMNYFGRVDIAKVQNQIGLDLPTYKNRGGGESYD